MFKPGMRVGDTVLVGDTQKIIIEVLPGGYILQETEAEEEQEEQITRKRKAEAWIRPACLKRAGHFKRKAVSV